MVANDGREAHSGTESPVAGSASTHFYPALAHASFCVGDTVLAIVKYARRQYRICPAGEHSLHEVEARIVPDQGWSPDCAERVRTGLHARFGPGVASRASHRGSIVTVRRSDG